MHICRRFIHLLRETNRVQRPERPESPPGRHRAHPAADHCRAAGRAGRTAAPRRLRGDAVERQPRPARARRRQGRDRYVLPAVEDALTPSHFETRAARSSKGYRAAGPTLTVLRTTVGAAQSVAARDRQGALARGRRHDCRRRHDLHRDGKPAAPATAAGSPPFHVSDAESSHDHRLPAGAKPILLAFSGGLDTSFCVPWLAETYGRPIITVTVDTGGIDADAAQRARGALEQLGAIAHHLVDARAAYFDQVLKFLIMGNVRRGQLYPLCVGAERVLQAQTIAQMGAQARHRRGRARLHRGRQRPGALRSRAAHARAGDRDHRAGARPRLQAARAARSTCEARKLPVPPFGAAYSVNRGLWGVTIGGKETLTSDSQHPRRRVGAVEGRVHESAAARAPHDRLRRTACPARSTAATLDPVAIIEQARGDRRAVRHRPRHPSRRHRHRHQGTRRVRGAGRGGAAHRASRTREARADSARQARIKDTLAQPYGDLVHEGQHLDPVCRDIEASASSPRRRASPARCTCCSGRASSSSKA